MPELVWTGDIEGNLNYFNQSVYDYTGLSPEKMRKEGWLQIVHPDDREENMRLWSDAVGTGQDFLFEHRFRRHDGEYNWQLSRAIPQRDATGNILMWVGTSTNIQQIKEQDQQKDLFISMASHELKTPVTSIKGYVQILQTMYAGGKDKFLKNSLNIVDRQIVTLTKLISELLDLSKIKSGNLVLNQENFDLNELIKDKIDEIKHINAAKSISFSKKGNPVVYADRDRIGQVLINFLTNAVKYSPDALKIKVKAVIKDNNVIVYVEDSGIGINKADQEKIFQRFYRVEGKNEKTFPGFGIGLFIAAEIIKRHNGKIGVESEPGKGSVFYFSLPVLNPL
jgi:PAS domain S-box-containing protein